ncbi:MAG: TlpA disulfide reductase family protein [Bryobacteraceae bacterium]
MRQSILRTITVAAVGLGVAFPAAQSRPALSPDEQAILTQLRGLRQVPDSQRGEVTAQLAVRIRQLPKTQAKLSLAFSLANLATEGDFGRRTLQEVATTLAGSLTEQPLPDGKDGPASAYITLAQLVRYEGIDASLDAAPFRAAMAKLEAEERQRASADLSLLDLDGKPWTLSGLRGKVVLVNFWATWCPPCRKEMPDLAALYAQFESRGLVILGISDETADKVAPFVQAHQVPYPVLLDPGAKVHALFSVEGIPKSFLYDREGKLVATAIDMRTRQQFLAMLAKAGLR